MEPIFKEDQKFTQWWLWAILIGIGIWTIFGIYKQLFLGENFGNTPMSDLGIIIFSLFIFGLIAMFWFMRLKTEIDQKGIRMSFFPFVRKRVSWKEIQSAEVLNYGFVGGWGIRLWTKHGTVYNTKGNIGLEIELTNGKKFVIGTQKEIEMSKVIADIKGQKIA